jgi:hypothetical protein
MYLLQSPQKTCQFNPKDQIAILRITDTDNESGFETVTA